jgi:RNA polymerase sigma factor (sigma-70 family)
MKHEKLEDLFLMMAMKNDDRKKAELAFNEFHNRFSKYLYATIKKATVPFYTIYGDELCDGVFQNTLLTIFEKADKFIIIDELNEKSKEMRIKAWLGKIAQTEMYILLRELRTEKDKICYNTEYINESDILDTIEEPKLPSFERKLLDCALSSLKERDRAILLTFYQYEEIGKNTPANAIEELCEYFSTTKENLRQIKKRTLEKVKKHIAEQLKIYDYERQ